MPRKQAEYSKMRFMSSSKILILTSIIIIFLNFDNDYLHQAQNLVYKNAQYQAFAGR